LSGGRATGGPAPRTPRWEATASQTRDLLVAGHGAPVRKFPRVWGHVCPQREGSGGQSPPDSASSRFSATRRALFAAILATPAIGAEVARWFTTSDGVRLRYLDAGAGRAVVFIPGWCMPASIFEPQIAALSRRWRVVSLDPRGQGESEVPRSGYDPARRGQDIRDLLQHLGTGRVVLAGWSLGVLDALSYADMAGDQRLAGLVLIDNSVGEGRAPPPRSTPSRFFVNLRQRRDATVRGFVASMYRTPQDQAYLDAIARQAQRMPVEASIRLLSYPRPREFWKQSLYAVRRPVYYAVTPRLRGQAEQVAQNHPQPMVEIFDGAGHALFVDAAARFNASMEEFLSHRAAWG
jgi:non-heme chloroperoxidase